MSKKQSIRGGIIQHLKDNETATTGDLTWVVGQYYQSNTGWGQQFLRQRVGEALALLLRDKIVERVSRGVYRYIEN